MALVLNLDEGDSRLLAERARLQSCPPEEVARQAVLAYLADPIQLREDAEDAAALADYERRKAAGPVAHIDQSRAREILGMPSAKRP